jgi:hypothetical protein
MIAGVDQAAWAMTGDAVKDWVLGAKAGDTLVYAKAQSLHSLRHSTGIKAINEMFDAGLITLTSRKLSPGFYSYIAQRLKTPSRPAPSARLAQRVVDPDSDDLASLMQILRRFAARHRPCPTNRELGQMIGGLNPDQAAYLLRKAQSRGRIRIDATNYGQRVVTITASGKRTARPA